MVLPEYSIIFSLQVTNELLVLSKGITNNTINPNLKAIVQN